MQVGMIYKIYIAATHVSVNLPPWQRKFTPGDKFTPG